MVKPKRHSPKPWTVYRLSCTTREAWLDWCGRLWDSVPPKRRTENPLIVTTGKGSRRKVVAVFAPSVQSMPNAQLIARAPNLPDLEDDAKWIVHSFTVKPPGQAASFSDSRSGPNKQQETTTTPTTPTQEKKQ